MARSLNLSIALIVFLEGMYGLTESSGPSPAEFLIALQLEGPKKTVAHRHKKSENPMGDPDLLAKRVEQPTGRPEKNESAAEATGVAQNAAGDLDAFIAALITNIVTICVMWIIMSFMRQRYPLVYSKNTLTLKNEVDEYEQSIEGDVQLKELLDQESKDKLGKVKQPGDGLFSWWSASANAKIEEIIECRGLDIAMLLRFSEVAMKITAIIGLPLVLFVGPLHCFCGGYRAGAPGTAEADYLSYWGMANVVDGHPWLYWAHALIMWLVIVTVQAMVYQAMREFMVYRINWLQRMPHPRSTTVLVQGIPVKKCSEQKLKEYFCDMFDSDCVEQVYIVKNTGKLESLAKIRDARASDVQKAKHKLNSLQVGDDAMDADVTVKEAADKALNDAQQQVETAAKEFEKEREQFFKDVGEDEEKLSDLKDDEDPSLNVNLTRGFVTFKSRRDAELAKMITYTTDAAEYVVEAPPDPTDVLWVDLQMNPTSETIMSVAGYALIAGVFWAYLPTVVAIAYYASLQTLAEYSPVFKSMAADPSISALWDGLANALALQLLLGFVPTFFGLIFSKFFCIKSGNSLQHKIQEWYFYFQVVFVLLVTAIGSSLLDTMEELVEDPTSVVYLLASTLPLATHFYLNYLPLQWVTHAQNMLRLANWFKFKAFSTLFGNAVAVKMAEPEDQDYYGLGSRSARFTFMLTLTLSFCSLSPLITILGFINFWMCRKCYGYLCVFCETRKPDLGGVFYVSQLTHVSQGLFIYIILMTGVLLERDLTVWPSLLSASGLIFQYVSYNRFKTMFRWENLCFDDLRNYDKQTKEKQDQNLRRQTGVYIQPVLLTDGDLKDQLVIGRSLARMQSQP